MSQSTEITGGTGFTFEGNLVATYLVSLLIEGLPRGLPGRTTKRVAVQQADFGEPLDDLVVDAEAPDGSFARLSLQVKRSLTISSAASNTDFRDIVVNARKTLDRSAFRDGIDRVGAATDEISAGAGRDVERVCKNGRASSSTDTFVTHFKPDSGTGQSQKKIVEDFRRILTDHFNRSIDDSEIHRLLRHFTILSFDLLHDGARDEIDAEERLRPFLNPEDTQQAGALWSRLKTVARESMGRSADFSRKTLLEHLHGEFRLAGAPSLRGDIDKLATATRLAIEDIGADIDGIEIERSALIEQTEQVAEIRRFIQLFGLPGSGKSAVLRAFATKRRQVGPVIVLKSDRLSTGGWPGFATSIGLSATDPEQILLELASIGAPTLVIDGIDRIEVSHRGVVTDLVSAILSKPALDRWRVVASLRDNGIEPLRTWLPQGLLAEGGVVTIEVGTFDDEESRKLAVSVPRLRSLLFASDERVRDIARRPFFAGVLARTLRAGSSSSVADPKSEIDLVEAWWSRGGYAAEGADTTRRQRTLKNLARSGASSMGRGMPIDDLDADALADLENDGIVIEVRSGHTVKFTHDIFFEWSFLHLLIARGSDWLAEIRSAGEPPVLGRVVELLSQSTLIANDNWQSHLARIETAGMRPQWTRAWLIGPFGTSGFGDHAATFGDAVFHDEARRFAKLAVWFQAEKTRSNPNVLAGTVPINGLSRFEVARLADLVAWPSDIHLWMRFCNWLLDNIQQCPINTISDITSAFEIWQNVWSNIANLVSQRIIETAIGWLHDIEDREHSEERNYNPGPWTSLDHDELSELEHRLRVLVLRSAVAMPVVGQQYLERLRERPRLRHETFGQVITFAPTLAARHGAELVDLALAELLDELPRQSLERDRDDYRLSLHSFDHDWRELSIRHGTGDFHPPSPLREPFASLFKTAPAEALRLVRTLCNHAMEAWLQLNDLDRVQHGVPIPLELDFPWGRQVFWGNAQIYGWFRGLLGPQTIQCALMSLEDWAFNQVKGGRDLDAVIRDVVSENGCCAVLGIAVALALTHNHVTASTLPLATSQRLWRWDIQRCVHDATSLPANLIGFNMTGREPAHAEAVRAGNALQVRKLAIRSLAWLFVLSADDKLRTECRAAVQAFPANLPFDSEEEKKHDDHVAALRRNAEFWSEIGKGENYVATAAEDGSGTIIRFENPRSGDADVVAAAQRSQEMSQWSGLWLWAENCFETGALSERMSMADAIVRAKSLDKPDLFKSRASGVALGDILLGGIAGTAAAVLCFGGILSDSDLEWGRGVIKRARETPEIRNGTWFSGSRVPYHPCIFAARGFAALIRRGIDAAEAKRQLLHLAVHPLDDVSTEAIGVGLACWDGDANFAWIALDLGLKLSIGTRQGIRSAYGYDPQADIDRRKRVVREALHNLETEQPLINLATIPPAWIFAPPLELHNPGGRVAKSPAAVWRESDELWLWHFVPKILARIPIQQVMADDLRRPHFLAMCTGMLTWTIDRLAPSWDTEERGRAGRRREDRSVDVLEWRRSLSIFLGKVSRHMDTEEARRLFLEPMFRLNDEMCASLLEPFVDVYICVAILDAPEIKHGAISFLEICVERLLANGRLMISSDRNGHIYGHYLPHLISSLFLIRHQAGGAARFANGDWTDVRLILPVVERLVASAGTFPHVIACFLTLCERAIEHYPSDRFVEQMLCVLDSKPATPSGWRGTMIPGRIAVLVHEFAERMQPLPHSLAQGMLRLLDRLVDMGDRRSAALQTSQIFKDVRIVPNAAS